MGNLTTIGIEISEQLRSFGINYMYRFAWFMTFSEENGKVRLSQLFAFFAKCLQINRAQILSIKEYMNTALVREVMILN